MGRSGVLFEEVKQAAEAMMLEGTNPTHARIRAVLGGGSFSTIGKHLHAWREGLRETGSATPPPEGLQAAVGQIWRELDAAATERIDAAEEAAQQGIAAAEASADARVADIEAQAAAEIEAAQAASVEAQAHARREIEAAVRGWHAESARVTAIQAQLDARTTELCAAKTQIAHLEEKLANAAVAAQVQKARDAKIIEALKIRLEGEGAEREALQEEQRRERVEILAERKAWRSDLAAARDALHAAQLQHKAAVKDAEAARCERDAALSQAAQASARTDEVRIQAKEAQSQLNAELQRRHEAHAAVVEALRIAQSQAERSADDLHEELHRRLDTRDAALARDFAAMEKRLTAALRPPLR